MPAKERQVVEAMSKAMFKRFLHDAIAQAHQLGERGDEDGLKLLGEIFGATHPTSEDDDDAR